MGNECQVETEPTHLFIQDNMQHLVKEDSPVGLLFLSAATGEGVFVV